MARRLRVLVAGHVCVDVVPELRSSVPRPGSLAEVGPVAIRVGGCVANTGRALVQLGAAVRLLTIVGSDLFGDTVVENLASLGVESSTVLRTPAEGTSYSIVLEAPGEDRAFLHHVGANAAFDPDHVDLDGIDLLHIGYPQLLPRLTREGGIRFIALLDRARRSGVTTSVDFAALDADAAARLPWSEFLGIWAPYIDVLTPSVDDLRPMLGYRSAQSPGELAAVAEELVRAGVACALVTAGWLGMALQTTQKPRLENAGRALSAAGAVWARRQLVCPAPAVEVVRTTGSGDVATAGFIAGLLAGMNPEGALRLAASAAGAHVSGEDPLPDRLPREYQSIPLRQVAFEGWRADELGVMHGPADGRVG